MLSGIKYRVFDVLWSSHVGHNQQRKIGRTESSREVTEVWSYLNSCESSSLFVLRFDMR